MRRFHRERPAGCRSGRGAVQMRWQGRTVLLVEDHPELREQIRLFLRSMGFATVEVGDAAAAIQRLASCRPDVICLDLTLPESSGYEVCEWIRRSREHGATPVLMMSDRAYPEDRAHAAEAGADAFLAKPFTLKMLRERIEALLPPPRLAVGS